MIRIIDNKKIDLTNDEWELYQKIAESYDRPNFQGKDLFKGLFETDENGMIIFLRPPTTYTSMEVFMFLVSVMVHQHVGTACLHVDKLSNILASKINDADKIINEGKQLINNFKKLSSTSK